MKSRCPQGLQIPANFSLLVIFFLLNKQQRWFDGSEQEAIFKWHHYLSGLAIFYSLISLLDSGLQFNIPIALQTIFQICLKCQKVLSISTPWGLRAVSLCDLLLEDKNGETDPLCDQVYLVPCLSHGPVVLNLDVLLLRDFRQCLGLLAALLASDRYSPGCCLIS